MENYEHFGKVNIQMLLILLRLPSDNLTVLSHLVLVTDTQHRLTLLCINRCSPCTTLHRQHLPLCIGQTRERCCSLSNLVWWKVTFKVPSNPKPFRILTKYSHTLLGTAGSLAERKHRVALSWVCLPLGTASHTCAALARVVSRVSSRI